MPEEMLSFILCKLCRDAEYLKIIKVSLMYFGVVGGEAQLRLPYVHLKKRKEKKRMASKFLC